MGFNAEQADAHTECMLIKREIIELLKRPTKQQIENWYTEKNYPNYPKYLIYQNKLMELGYSDTNREELAKYRFAHAEAAKVGDLITCCGCGTQFKKKTWNQKFCGAKKSGSSTCKDFIHNWLSPKRLNRTIYSIGLQENK